MPGPPEVVYGIVYKLGVLERTQYLFLTSDIDEARRYAVDIYPGSIIVSMTVVPLDGGE
jgi:hypothetical protein